MIAYAVRAVIVYVVYCVVVDVASYVDVDVVSDAVVVDIVRRCGLIDVTIANVTVRCQY